MKGPLSQSICTKGLDAVRHLLLHDQFSVLVGVSFIAGMAKPSPGASYYSQIAPTLMRILFVLTGYTIPVHELISAGAAVKLHVSIQIFSLFVIPFFFFLTLFKSGLAASLLGSSALANGLMACMCLPTTTNTGVLFTMQAKGDVAASSINAVIGNIVGTFSAPVIAALTIGGTVASQDTASTLLILSKTIIGPLLSGLALQTATKKWIPQLLTPQLLATVKNVAGLILVAILYLLFCKAFSSSDGTSLSTLTRLCCLVGIVHLLILGAAWAAVHLFDVTRERRVAFMFMAPQKTEAMGVAILTTIFRESADDIGTLALPIVVYHTMQMISSVAMVRYLNDEEQPLRLAASSETISYSALASEDSEEGGV